MVTETKNRSPLDAVQSAREILTAECNDLRSSLYKDLVLNALKCKRDELDTLDLKVINRTLAEFRHAARAFKPFRGVRKLSIFGSGRVTANSPNYQQAVKLGELAVKEGYMVITGAADGIMRAGIEGAGTENSFGVKILLPFEGAPNKFIRDDPKLINFKYFFTRKIFFVMEADAVALFPGGFGTHDEGFEVLTLLQTGKAPPMPVVLVEAPGDDYWEAWDQFIRLQFLTRHLISKEDLCFYRIVKTPEEARNWIKYYYSSYHSMRQVGRTLVIRLEKELSDFQLKGLSERYADLFENGEIQKCEPLAEEADEPDLLSKPRISFQYNHKSAGRLNELVLAINRCGEEI
jgi:uncharacterized protein (TIGR00730 family)